jgi:hypothetical protein
MHTLRTKLQLRVRSKTIEAAVAAEVTRRTQFRARTRLVTSVATALLNAPWLLLVPTIFLLGGCAHSPTVDVLGSYFPAWMLCIIVGLVSTLIVRLLLIGFGIYSHLRLKPLVFSCMALSFTFVVWLGFFKN